MGGGREIPIPIFTPAIVGIGATIASANSIIPKNNLFICCPLLNKHKGFIEKVN
jgi:hypothetical protein